MRNSPHGEGQTYLREVLLTADHSAYHVGELGSGETFAGCLEVSLGLKPL